MTTIGEAVSSLLVSIARIEARLDKIENEQQLTRQAILRVECKNDDIKSDINNMADLIRAWHMAFREYTKAIGLAQADEGA